ncbi:lipopolysaccharide biosynthesis protein [Sinomicrobium sp. M5D2P17]
MSFKLIKEKFLKSEFTRHVLTLLSGTALAQAIPILISPIITRLYSPEEIGEYTIFFATSNILALLVSGRLELAILIPKKRKEGIMVLILSLFFSLILFSFLLLLFVSFNETIASFLGLGSFSRWLFLIPFTSLFLAFFQIFSYWLNRGDKYDIISKGKVLQGTITGIIHVSFSFLSVLGLFLGRISGVFTSVIYMLISKGTLDMEQKNAINSKLMIKTLQKYRVFPLVTMPNALLNMTSNNLPNYLLETLYTLQQTGFYAWSVRIVQGPMWLITSSLQQVFFKRASETFNEHGDLYGLVIKMYKRLFILGIIPYTLLYLFSADIFEIIFGMEWRTAGEYTSYLVPWLFVVFLNSPVSNVIIILNKQKEYFLYEIALFLCRSGALVSGYYILNEAKYSIIFYGIVGLIFNTLLFFITLKISKQAYD